jgi:RNA polymerase sigma-70 factor (ECF subfamily)
MGLVIALPLGPASGEYRVAMARLRDRLPARPEGDRLSEEDASLVERLRAGDEDAFAQLVERYGASMLRIARMHVRDRAVAEEVVQETWLAVLNGIDRFEGRSSLKTWIFRILSNRAKTRGEREGRTVPFSAVLAGEATEGEPAVDADRFLGPDNSKTPYAWASPPRAWTQDQVIARETLGVLRDAIDELPPAQREVIRLRDIEGWSAEEVAHALDVSDVNQRVLLHRARSKVRGALERYLDPDLERAR